MGAPKGNQNGKNGGRPSAYQERQNAEDALDIWFNDRERSVIAAKIKSGKYSVRDMFIFKALGGNEKILTALQKKVHPDFVKQENTGTVTIKIVNYGNDNNAAAQLQPSDEAVPVGGSAEPSQVQVADYPPQGGQDGVGPQ